MHDCNCARLASIRIRLSSSDSPTAAALAGRSLCTRERVYRVRGGVTNSVTIVVKLNNESVIGDASAVTPKTACRAGYGSIRWTRAAFTAARARRSDPVASASLWYLPVNVIQ